jgi:hypothetical protein
MRKEAIFVARGEKEGMLSGCCCIRQVHFPSSCTGLDENLGIRPTNTSDTAYQ